MLFLMTFVRQNLNFRSVMYMGAVTRHLNTFFCIFFFSKQERKERLTCALNKSIFTSVQLFSMTFLRYSQIFFHVSPFSGYIFDMSLPTNLPLLDYFSNRLSCFVAPSGRVDWTGWAGRTRRMQHDTGEVVPQV